MYFIICLFLIQVVAGSELYRTSHFPAQDSVPVSTFSYTGLTGPLNWYGLNKSANGMCDMGKTQSPINIDGSVDIESGSSVTLIVPDVSEAEFENLGTNVEVVVNGTINYRNKAYKLAQFHYHTPSEHRINDEHFPMEQHFVFEASDGSIAVLGFLLELDDSGINGPLQEAVFRHIKDIPNPGDATMMGPLRFGPITAHLHRHKIFTYMGSLTTPPCSQNVQWIISTKPIRINIKTYLTNKRILKFNSRYTQDELGKINLLEKAAHELKS